MDYTHGRMFTSIPPLHLSGADSSTLSATLSTSSAVLPSEGRMQATDAQVADRASVAAAVAVDGAVAPGVRGASPALVLYTGNAAISDSEAAVLARLERFKLRALVREILESRRVKWCQKRRINSKQASIDIYQHIERGTCRVGNLARCGMSQVCPYCAFVDGEKVRAELTQAVRWGREHGYQILFSTFTVAHGRGDSLRAELDAICKAYRTMTSDRAYKELCLAFGVDHVVRSLEATVGSWHGWHAHFHGLPFMRLGNDSVAFQEQLAPLWAASVGKQGFAASLDRGVWIEPAQDKVEEYIAKWGHEPKRRPWAAEDELSRSHSKHGHGDRSLTPFDLLRKIAELRKGLPGLDGSELVKARYHLGKYEGWFREYDEAVFRRHRIEYTPGLRYAVGLPCKQLEEERKKAKEQADRVRAEQEQALSFEDWLDDEQYIALQAVEDVPAPAEVWLASVSFADWLVVDRVDLTGQLLEAGRRAGAEGIRQFVALVLEADRRKASARAAGEAAHV